MHTFKESLKRGQAGESALDKYFSRYYEIYTPGRSADARGIDRVFYGLHSPVRWTVQYKTDYETADFLNAFIEVTSVAASRSYSGRHNTEVPGWAYTCYSQLLIYYVPAWGEALRLSTADIKWSLEEWLIRYPVKDSHNRREDGTAYTSQGICVPYKELEAICYDTHYIEEEL